MRPFNFFLIVLIVALVVFNLVLFSDFWFGDGSDLVVMNRSMSVWELDGSHEVFWCLNGYSVYCVPSF